MAKKISALLLGALLAGSTGGLSFRQRAALAAAPASWQKGVNIRSRWSGDFGSSDFKQTVDNAAKDNINYVTLVFNYYQSNLTSTDIQPGGDTPTDSALIAAIDYIHAKGLGVVLTPHLESYTGEWRANINPPDRGAWFQNYGNLLQHYGQIAQVHGVEVICVGSELIDMSTASANPSNTQNWLNLINQLRGMYSGQLTYSANWGPAGFADEKNNIQFWGALDYIGISAYFNLYSDNSVAGLEAAWDGYRQNDIQPLSQRWNKPVVFTEIGYRSVSNAHTQPWDYNLGGAYDAQEQANDYQALFDYWSRQSFMHGVQLWEWDSNPSSGGAGNTDYTPQQKPAEQVMQTWLGAGTITPPSGNVSFTSTAAVSGSQITATVTANNGQGAGIIVDVEIYNQAGQQVKQQIFDNQNFSTGQSQTYSPSFTSQAGINYTVKIGIFNYNWSELYNWNDSAAVFSGGGAASGGNNPPPNNPPPPNSPPPATSLVYVNSYPTQNGNYLDCDGSIDNDMAHHTVAASDSDPAHHLGQNCPANSYVATH